MVKVIEGTIEEEKEGPVGPSIVPGPSSGSSVRSETDVRQQPGDGVWKREKRIPTTNGFCFAGVPNVLILGRTVSTLAEEKALATNRDVEESPPGETSSQRDRVGEPANQRQYRTQKILYHVRNSRRGRHNRRAISYKFRPANDRHMSTKS